MNKKTEREHYLQNFKRENKVSDLFQEGVVEIGDK